MAKRYGQRPSSLLGDAIPPKLRLWFDLNVAVKGMAAEAIAAQPKSKGETKTKAQAMRLIQKAKADVLAMEQEAARNKSA